MGQWSPTTEGTLVTSTEVVGLDPVSAEKIRADADRLKEQAGVFRRPLRIEIGSKRLIAPANGTRAAGLSHHNRIRLDRQYFETGSQRGRGLLAHEITHFAQFQRRSASHHTDRAEAEARLNARLNARHAAVRPVQHGLPLDYVAAAPPDEIEMDDAERAKLESRYTNLHEKSLARAQALVDTAPDREQVKSWIAQMQAVGVALGRALPLMTEKERLKAGAAGEAVAELVHTLNQLADTRSILNRFLLTTKSENPAPSPDAFRLLIQTKDELAQVRAQLRNRKLARKISPRGSKALKATLAAARDVRTAVSKRVFERGATKAFNKTKRLVNRNRAGGTRDVAHNRPLRGSSRDLKPKETISLKFVDSETRSASLARMWDLLSSSDLDPKLSGVEKVPKQNRLNPKTFSQKSQLLAAVTGDPASHAARVESILSELEKSHRFTPARRASIKTQLLGLIDKVASTPHLSSGRQAELRTLLENGLRDSATRSFAKQIIKAGRQWPFGVLHFMDKVDRGYTSASPPHANLFEVYKGNLVKHNFFGMDPITVDKTAAKGLDKAAAIYFNRNKALPPNMRVRIGRETGARNFRAGKKGNLRSMLVGTKGVSFAGHERGRSIDVNYGKKGDWKNLQVPGNDDIWLVVREVLRFAGSDLADFPFGKHKTVAQTAEFVTASAIFKAHFKAWKTMVVKPVPIRIRLRRPTELGDRKKTADEALEDRQDALLRESNQRAKGSLRTKIDRLTPGLSKNGLPSVRAFMKAAKAAGLTTKSRDVKVGLANVEKASKGERWRRNQILATMDGNRERFRSWARRWRRKDKNWKRQDTGDHFGDAHADLKKGFSKLEAILRNWDVARIRSQNERDPRLQADLATQAFTHGFGLKKRIADWEQKVRSSNKKRAGRVATFIRGVGTLPKKKPLKLDKLNKKLNSRWNVWKRAQDKKTSLSTDPVMVKAQGVRNVKTMLNALKKYNYYYQSWEKHGITDLPLEFILSMECGGWHSGIRYSREDIHHFDFKGTVRPGNPICPAAGDAK